MSRLIMLLMLGACVPSSAHVAGDRVDEDCGVRWPTETQLELPTTTVDALNWHDSNWKRGHAAFTSCRDAYKALARKYNERIVK